MPIADDVVLGQDARILYPDMVNLYGCAIGANSSIGPFVEVQEGVVIGDRCKIQSHSFLCTGVTLHDEVFVGHGVMFVNDNFPQATNADGITKSAKDWEVRPTVVGKRASIGSNATILGGVKIGAGAMIGAGAVVTADVPDFGIAVGVPARVVGDARSRQPDH